MKLPVGARKPGLGFRAVFGRCLFPAVLLLLFLDAALSDRLLSSHLRHRRLSLRARSHPAPSFLSTPDGTFALATPYRQKRSALLVQGGARGGRTLEREKSPASST